MNEDFLPIYRTYDDEQLYTILQSGSTFYESDAIEAARAVLFERGYPKDKKAIFMDIFIHYPDEELIAIVEAEEDEFHVDAIEVAENILFERGYQIAEEQQENSQPEVNPGPKGEDREDFDDFEIIQGETTSNNNDDLNSEMDNRLITRKEVNVYKDTRLKQIIRQEPENKLIAYHREVVRNGMELILLKELDGSKAYIRNNKRQVFLCQQCQVKKEPVDILRMPFSDFDDYKLTDTINRNQLATAFSGNTRSQFRTTNDCLFALTKDRFQKEGKDIVSVNNIGFKSDISDKVKLGRLMPGAKFYITHPVQTLKAIKIKTTDGQPGILLSDPETYEEIKTPLEKAVAFLMSAIFILVILWAMISILANTGYLIFIGILLIPLFYIIFLFIGVPLYGLFYELGKRF